MHGLNAQIGAIEQISPTGDRPPLPIQQGVIEVETLRLKAKLTTARAEHQMPTTGQTTSSRCTLRLLSVAA